MPSKSLASALQPAAETLRRLATIQPKEAKLTVGLDIGSTAIKVVALGARKGSGPRPVIGQQLLPIDPEKDADASNAIKAAIGSLPVPIKTVNVAVSGPWVIMRVVEMPAMKPVEMKQALPFEAQRYLPFNVQEVVIDGVMLGSADANKMWVLIVACKKELIERRVDWAKRAGLEIALIDVDALALANALTSAANGQEAAATRALINVGGQFTNLVIFRGKTPYLVRDIPWGGDKLARGIAEQLGSDPSAVSEQIQQNTTSPELSAAMKVMTEALVTELQLSFDYFENQFGQPPSEVLVSGGLGQSTALLETLKGQLTQSVAAWAPVAGLSGQFAVAYGLALRSE